MVSILMITQQKADKKGQDIFNFSSLVSLTKKNDV